MRVGAFEREGDFVGGAGLQIDDAAAIVAFAFRGLHRVVAHRQPLVPCVLRALAKLHQHILPGLPVFGRPVDAQAMEGGNGRRWNFGRGERSGIRSSLA